MSQKDAGNIQHQAEHAQSHRHPPILGYLVILFAVAFLLLLIAYFQQQRINSETTDALKQSVSAVDSIQKLMDENKSLQAENESLSEREEQLKAQLEEALDSVETLTATVSNLKQAQEQVEGAMDWFWQLDEAYVRGRYSLCREIVQTLEDDSDGKTPLKEFLPEESYTDNGRLSPAQRYQEIYNVLY